ncbi:MAG: YqgQ family protein [Planifilum fimeticola]
MFSVRTMEDVRLLLKRFGIWIYTGDRLGDLEMMEEELEEMHRLGLIDKDTYLSARRVIMQQKRMFRG